MFTLKVSAVTHVHITGKLILVFHEAFDIFCLLVATHVTGHVSKNRHCHAVHTSHNIYGLSVTNHHELHKILVTCEVTILIVGILYTPPN